MDRIRSSATSHKLRHGMYVRKYVIISTWRIDLFIPTRNGFPAVSVPRDPSGRPQINNTYLKVIQLPLKHM